MSSNPASTVYIGNLDERVSDRVLYDILIQAGRVVDLYIPRDKETDRPKGFAFAEYETEEIADYAVRLFSGLVTLNSRTLRFAISGQDKNTPNFAPSSMSASNSTFKPRLQTLSPNNVDVSPGSTTLTTSLGFSTHYARAPVSPGAYHSNGYRSHVDLNIHDYRRGLGATWDGVTHFSRSSRYDTSNSAFYSN